MATSRKPTHLGIPAPVPPASTTPLRPQLSVDLETPQTIDPGLVAENTEIEDEEQKKTFASAAPGEAKAGVSLGDSDSDPDSDSDSNSDSDSDPDDSDEPDAEIATTAAKPVEAMPPAGPADAGEDEPRWEEHSTVAEKSSSRRGLLPAPLEPRPMGSGGAQVTQDLPALPPSRRDDSARVLIDFDDSRVGGPTNVDDIAVIASMPTAINPSASGEPPAPAPIGLLAEGRLVVIGGNDRGREFVLTARETSLGRGADNDIILTDIAVSRRHILLFADGARYGVRDLTSGNGTLINGVRIVDDVFVHDGDQLELGNTLIRFEQPGAITSMGATPSVLRGNGAAGVVVGGGLMPVQARGATLGVTGMPGVPGLPPIAMSAAALPGIPPHPSPRMTMPFVSRAGSPAPGSLGSSLPLPPGSPPGVFAPAGGTVPPPHPVPAVAAASTSGFVPVPPMLGPQYPSPRAMDLLKDQRKLLLYMAGGVAAFALLVFTAVKLSDQPERKHVVVSTEASPGTSPALDKLLTDVEPPAPASAPVDTPVAALVASTAPAPPVVETTPVPAPVPTPAPAPEPEIVISPPGPAPAPAPKLAPRPRPVVVPKAPRRPPPAAPKDKTSVAERTAVAMYKQREFTRAADILHTAATKESGAGANRLETLAKDFNQIGLQVAKGDAAAAANPTVAVAAYKQAYALDARSGRGAHAGYLKSQLGRVLPRAATAFLNAGKFELARAACDDAAMYGSGDDPTIGRIRGTLEGKARELYSQGTSIARSKPDEAKALWRRVLKMVPADSPWYAKSYAALNKAKVATDEDE